MPGSPGAQPLLLASASPRRRELLALLGVPFEAVATEVEELTEGDQAELVVAKALRKARAGRELVAAGDGVSDGSGRIVIGVDTDVAIAGEVLGKPTDATGAAARLRRLSGRAHEVLSGVAVIAPGGEEEAGLERTVVRFRDLAEHEIEAYVASREWEDRAGGYAVQGLGSSLVSRIDGDLSNVIGLPISLLTAMIARLHDD